MDNLTIDKTVWLVPAEFAPSIVGSVCFAPSCQHPSKPNSMCPEKLSFPKVSGSSGAHSLFQVLESKCGISLGLPGLTGAPPLSWGVGGGGPRSAGYQLDVPSGSSFSLLPALSLSPPT